MKILSLLVLFIATSLFAKDATHHWAFDGNFHDQVTALAAVKVGEPTFTSGVKNTGVVFAGDSALSFLKGMNAFENFSIAAWVRSSENVLQGRILEKGASNSIWLYATNGLLVGGFFDAAKRKYQDVSATTEILDNQWHFAVVTFDGKSLKLFLDGKLENTLNLPQGTKPNNNEEPFVIGSKYQGYQHDNLVGVMDELSFHNRALSEEEISALFTAGKGG